jgi:alpha-galactosidase
MRNPLVRRLGTYAAIAGLTGLVLAASRPPAALDNGLARTPPMGWNSWNKFGCNVSDALIRGVADAISTNGMREAGYKALADYVHG